MKKIFISIYILLSLGFILIAQEKKMKNIEDISFEEILNTNVTTATKSKLTISEAPAIISVITAEQIEKFGVRKLSDILRFIPGFVLLDSYWKPDIVVARGIRPSLYNDKVLMLINGVSAYDAASIEFFLDSVPIDAVEKIEVIRGPGSTLYGTNAFAGVVNVITKEKGKKSMRLALGSFKDKEVGLFFTKKTGKFDMLFSASMRDDYGYEKEIVDESGIYGKNIYERDIHSFFSRIKFGDFTFNIGHSYQRYGKFGATPLFAFGNNNITENGKTTLYKTYANLFCEKNFGKFETKLTLHFDTTDKNSDTGSFGKIFEQLGILPYDTVGDITYIRNGGTVLSAEFQGKYSFRNLTITGGLSAENRETKWLSGVYDNLLGNLLTVASSKEVPFSLNDFAGFLQIDGKTATKLGYILGIRLTKLGINNKLYTNPRAGLVYSFSKNSSFKILYGEAFRSPGPQEQYYSVAGLIYGPDIFGNQLEPERIRTIEVAIDSTIFKRYKLLANLFTTKVFDIIGRRDSTADEYLIINNNAKVYDNLDNQKLKGFEFELKGYPDIDKVSNFFLNLSYKEGMEENGDEIPYLAKITGNAGISFKLSKNMNLSLFYQYIGKRDGTMTDGKRVSVPSYSLLSLTTGLKLDDNIKIGLNIQNLTDTEYFYPEFVRRMTATIPGGNGRSFVIWLKYSL